MKVSFVILNYKTREFLKNHLQNILEIQLPIEYEVIVVDNASSDGSVELVQQEFLNKKVPMELRLIASNKNLGWSAGNNLGVREARGEYVVLSNTDILYSNAADVVNVVRFMDEHPEVGIVGPRLWNPDGTYQYSCYRFYRFLTPVYRRTPFGKFSFAKRDVERHLMMDFAHDTIREVDWLQGSNMFIRRSVFEQIGLIDERFFLYFSDLEFCFRAWDHNIKVVYFPDTHTTHFHKRESATSHGLSVLFSYITRIHIKDWIRYLRKHKNRLPRFRTQEI